MDQRLRRRLGRVLQHGRWIIVGTLLCMFITFIINRSLRKIYAATTYILVVEPRTSSTSMLAWDYTLIPTYVPLVDNDAIIAQALQNFHLEGAPFRLTAHRFRQKGYLDIRLPKSSRLIEIDVRFPDARLAADIANYLAQSAVEVNDQANELEAATTQKMLKERLDRAAARLSETEASRVALQKKAKIDSRDTQLEILLGEKAQVSKQIESLQLAFAQHDGALKSLQQPLSTEPRSLYLKESVTSDRLQKPSTKKLGGNDPKTPPGNDEVLNAASEELRRKLADSAAQVEGEREALQAAGSRLPQIERQINDLLNETTELRGEIERSDEDFRLADEAYVSASRDYRDASVSVTARSIALRHISPALIPEQPVGLGALLNAILAGMLAFVLLSGAGVGLESLREIRSAWLGESVQEESESVSVHSS